MPGDVASGPAVEASVVTCPGATSSTEILPGVNSGLRVARVSLSQVRRCETLWQKRWKLPATCGGSSVLRSTLCLDVRVRDGRIEVKVALRSGDHGAGVSAGQSGNR
jgi:ribosomal protein S5